MDKAQKKAWEVYPEPVQANYPDSFDGYEQYLQDSVTNSLSRACFTEGYRSCEKGMKLDWVDVSIMDKILHEVLEQEKIHIEQGPASYYEEVLRRFNEYKEERVNKHDHC